MQRRKKRHHRKVKQERWGDTVERAPEEMTVLPNPVAVEGDRINGQLVKRDLSFTLITTVILLAGLLVAAYLNQIKSWTAPVGTALYQVLHIQ